MTVIVDSWTTGIPFDVFGFGYKGADGFGQSVVEFGRMGGLDCLEIFFVLLYSNSVTKLNIVAGCGCAYRNG